MGNKFHCNEVTAPQQGEKEAQGNKVAPPLCRLEHMSEFEDREAELQRKIESLTAAVSRAKSTGYKEEQENEDGNIPFFVGSIQCGGSSETSIGSTSKGSQASEEALALPPTPLR